LLGYYHPFENDVDGREGKKGEDRTLQEPTPHLSLGPELDKKTVFPFLFQTSASKQKKHSTTIILMENGKLNA